MGTGTHAGATINRLATNGELVINGDAGTPSNVKIGAITSDPGGTCRVTLGNFHFYSATNPVSNLLAVSGYTKLLNIAFTSLATYHVQVSTHGAVVVANSTTLTFSADCQFALYAENSQIRITGGSIVSNMAVSGNFAAAGSCGFVAITGVTISGTTTGSRYLCNLNGAIWVDNAGVNYLPGNAAGSLSNGGVYS